MGYLENAPARIKGKSNFYQEDRIVISRFRPSTSALQCIICSIKWGVDVDVSLCSVLQDTNLHNIQVRETFPPNSYKLHRHSESFSQEMMKSLCVVKWRIQLSQEATHSLLSNWSPLSWFKDITSLMLPAENAGFSLQMLHSTANKLNQHNKVLL